MSDECISPLRRRMIEDMTVRKFTLKTQSDYIRVVKNFTIFLGRSPDTASNEDLRRFQLHLSEKRVGAPTINLTISALRFFFTVTLDRTDAVKHLMFVAEPSSLAKSHDKKSGLSMPGGNMLYVQSRLDVHPLFRLARFVRGSVGRLAGARRTAQGRRRRGVMLVRRARDLRDALARAHLRGDGRDHGEPNV